MGSRARFLAPLALSAAVALIAANALLARQPARAFSIWSSDFSPNGFIAPRYTCSGENISPQLRWSSPPAGTVAFALTVTDPDAPAHTWVHWVLYNLPPGSRDLPQAIPHGNTAPDGGVQGRNDFGDVGYGGPCPPPGKAHHYIFTLYALNARLPLRPGATRRQTLAAMKGHILAQAVLTALFRR